MPFVNTPVVRASTVLFEQVADMYAPGSRYVYGRRGTPTSNSLEEMVSDLEGAEGTVVTPSGLAAVAVALLSFVGAGDHILITDTAYGPTREFADGVLKRMGVETTYYDPGIGAGIAALMRPNTRVVYMESPGSITMEMQDVPAIAAVARAQGAIAITDNTWATPLYFRPLDHGVDVSLTAATKYYVGHSDAMLGTVSAGPRAWKQLKLTHGLFGMFTGPDDMYLALRGLRTLAVRLARHQDSALTLARWLQGRAEVAEVLHPALPGHLGHAIWARDFSGSSGLFSFVLDREYSKTAISAMLDGLNLFGLGYSWGGFESLAIVGHVEKLRTATTRSNPAQIIRLNVGLEDPADLMADLEAGFQRLRAAG